MNEYLVKLDKVIEAYLVKKAPKLPANGKEALVKFAPWLAVVGVVMGAPAILAVLGLGAFMTPFVWLAGARTGFFWIWWLILIVQVIFEVMAIKPLFAKKIAGWNFMFYAQLLAVVSSFQYFNVGGLLFTVLAFYLLYQVKSSYK
ncbi:MAG: hypothetical protein ABII21_01010 [bacterium]